LGGGGRYNPKPPCGFWIPHTPWPDLTHSGRRALQFHEPEITPFLESTNLQVVLPTLFLEPTKLKRFDQSSAQTRTVISGAHPFARIIARFLLFSASTQLSVQRKRLQIDKTRR
jgi:hypothetical protein